MLFLLESMGGTPNHSQTSADEWAPAHFSDHGRQVGGYRDWIFEVSQVLGALSAQWNAARIFVGRVNPRLSVEDVVDARNVLGLASDLVRGLPATAGKAWISAP
jgi:hypothetical protein